MSESGAAMTPAPVRAFGPWSWLLVGFAAMYLPVYWEASTGLWQTDELGHGPIILGLVIWLFWRARREIATATTRPAAALGLSLFASGLLIYVFGRLFSVASVTFASQIFVLAGGLALLGGYGALKAAWFPLLYILFMVPLPASLVEALTGPLKNWISVIVVDSLYAIGLPVSRAGVTISIGPYQLLVADACTGLNSMFSLAATGALFMFIAGRASRLHNAVMLASIIPIAFVANIVRVTALVLITYFFGDDAAQGFLHSTAGLMLFVVALALFVGLDKCISAFSNSRQRAGGR